MKTKKITALLPAILLSGALFSQIAFAQQTVSPTPTYSGAEATIKQYLCTPTITNSGTTASLATTQNTGANNPASNDLYNCINRMYRFAIVAASALTVFFIVIAGYVYMSADGDGEAVTRAKGILASSLASLVILFAGYIILRALNPDLIQFQNVQPPSVRTGSSTFTTNITPGTTPGTIPGTIPGTTPGTSPSTMCQPDPNYNCNEAGAAAKCAQYDSMIAKYASVVPAGNGAALLKSMMYHETRCNPNLTSSAGAYGLLQMKIPTANTFKSNCGITEEITPDWFKTNPEKSICLSAYLLKYLSADNICSSDIGRTLSGYAEGQASCKTRTSCPLAASQFLTCYNQFSK